jgi:glycosyltransferase involved in cell wall biosynthesis
MKQKILILYTELAGYTLACINRFTEKYPDTELHLVRWPVNSEAPFEFDFANQLQVYERHNYSRDELLALAEKIKPDLILCSGWIDKDYVRVCRKWIDRIPVVLVMDNKWLGTWKQQIARLISRFSILKGFSHAWVPGLEQRKYALRLGFPEDKIRTGFYSADTNFFNGEYLNNKESKLKSFPHRFIYSGRYYDFKGVRELWNAFIELKKSVPNDWELWCLGTGDIPPVEHSDIKHLGFVQPEKLVEVIKETGIFVLPSKIEPWGVVVHEFAAAGFPLLLSTDTGARGAFLQEGKNGFSFRTNDADSIRTALRSVIALSDEKLARMGDISNALSVGVNPDRWADTLFSFLQTEK